MSLFPRPRPRPRKKRPIAYDGTGPSGSTVWFLGLIAVLVPVLGAVVAGPVMFARSRREAPENAFAREHCRRAVNWGLTYSVLTVLLAIVHFGVWGVLAARGIEVRGFAPLGYVVLLWLFISAVHVGVCCIGWLRARRGEDFEWKLALRFVD